MLKLDEPLKHNWLIKYSNIYINDDANDTDKILAEGRIYDFIPNVEDTIGIEGKWYRVTSRTINFDTSTITVHLIPIEF